MIVYQKLIRDRIPEIIEATGKTCSVRVLDEAEFVAKLAEKLGEEVLEYRVSREISELADVVEVVYALLDQAGVSREEFEQIRLKKAQARGGFGKRLLLESVEG